MGGRLFADNPQAGRYGIVARTATDRLAGELVRRHGGSGSDSVLAGAEQVMHTVQSLPPQIQRPVLDLLFQVFDQARAGRPASRGAAGKPVPPRAGVPSAHAWS